ncbi:MAG: NUDIX domain-containing protein [Cyclobacteriaceae bacterium]
MHSYYLTNLRKKIGNDYLLLPSVTALILNANNELLLVKHHDREVWVAPGGMVEPDEYPIDTVVREVLEETGLCVIPNGILGVYGGPEFRVTYKNGDETGYVMTVYFAKVIAGILKHDGEETLDASYFPLDKIQGLSVGRWLPTVLYDLDHYLKAKKVFQLRGIDSYP